MKLEYNGEISSTLNLMYNWKVSREIGINEMITKGELIDEVKNANPEKEGSYSFDYALPQSWLNETTQVLFDNQLHLDFPRFLQESDKLSKEDIYDLIRSSFVTVYPDTKWIGYLTPITTIGKFLSLVLKQVNDGYGLDHDFFKVVPSDNELHFQNINRKYK